MGVGTGVGPGDVVPEFAPLKLPQSAGKGPAGLLGSTRTLLIKWLSFIIKPGRQGGGTELGGSNLP